MAKERVDVLAYKQGLFETREQAKRGVMAGLVVAVLNGERFDKPGEKIPDDTTLTIDSISKGICWAISSNFAFA